MFERGLLLFLYTATATHAGASESETVDLAIQRNGTTGWPIFQGSGLKGALRDVAPADNDDDARDRHAAFGPDPQDRRGTSQFAPGQAQDHAGALSIGDAEILAFPVQSLAGVFAWITCRHAIRELQRLHRLLPAARQANQQHDWLWKWEPVEVGLAEACWTPGSPLAITTQDEHGKDVSCLVLQDLTLDAAQQKEPKLAKFADALAELALPAEPKLLREKLRSHLVLVHDSVFTDLVEAGIHVITRVKIEDNSGRAAESGPWDEELLPAETILYAPVLAGAPGALKDADGALNYFVRRVIRDGTNPRCFQMGGDATVGRGWVYPHEGFDDTAQPGGAGGNSTAKSPAGSPLSDGTAQPVHQGGDR